jgi:hypothetical protein
VQFLPGDVVVVARSALKLDEPTIARQARYGLRLRTITALPLEADFVAAELVDDDSKKIGAESYVAMANCALLVSLGCLVKVARPYE